MPYHPFTQKNKEYESRIHEFRILRDLTVVALAKAAGTGYGDVADLASGITPPIYSIGTQTGTWKPQALRICKALRAEPEDVFPRYVCSIKPDYLSQEQLASLSISEFSINSCLPYNDAIEQAKEIYQGMSHLSRQSLKVIICRYILGMTLDATGKFFGVTKERIRQIEYRSIRKLIHFVKIHYGVNNVN